MSSVGKRPFVADHERAVVEHLVDLSGDQPWWLGYLDTGATDVVFPDAPMVSLYTDWDYVLVEAGPEQALTWRVGHMRSPHTACCRTCSSLSTGPGWSPHSGTTPGPASGARPSSSIGYALTRESEPGQSGWVRTPLHRAASPSSVTYGKRDGG